MGNIPPGMGYRNVSELTPKQSEMMHDCFRMKTGLPINEPNDVRTAHSLIKKTYATWNEDERILFLTQLGIEWCQNHDRKVRVK